MKKRFLVLFFTVLSFSCFSAVKLKFPQDITLIFEGCEDGSIRFEAVNKKPYAPVKKYELKRKTAKTKFEKQSDGSYFWNDYKIIPSETGYFLYFKDKLLYEAGFTQEKNTLKEKRVWATATGFYGFGEASSTFNLSDQSLTIFNESKATQHAFLFIPFYFTNESTSVYFNANGKDKIYFQNGNNYQLYRTEYGRIESFVRQDVTNEDCVKKFYQETESLCMLPKWSFGYIQSKYGYKSSVETLDVVQKFKENEIPLSAVVLDLYWFKRMGDIWWTSENFKDYPKMIKTLQNEDVKLITITEPFFTENCDNFEELKSKNLLCKNENGKIQLWRDWWNLEEKTKKGGLFNPLAKSASSFMGEKYSKMLDSGISGFWTDLGEPEAAWKQDGLKIDRFKERDFHNYYNLYWTKALYEGVKAHYPDKRLFIMSRSGFTGSGKYNVSVWSGDVSVSWSSLSRQTAFGLNSGLSGLPYWGSDVGGFSTPDSPEELYVRWQQFGAFTPIYRAHGYGPREPYIYSEKAKNIVKQLIEERMQLLPYIYSTARQTMRGIPMMRPMFFEDCDTPAEFAEHQFMFGDSILVCPVYYPKTQKDNFTLFIPKGIWYDYSTFEQVPCGQVVIKNEIEKNPVYIKQGAIIPCEKDGKNYIFMIPDSSSESSFVLYDDDGETEQYKTGVFSELEIKLTGLKLSASASENKKFLKNEYILAVPSFVKTSSDWILSGKFKTRKVTLEQMIGGIEL